jgi:50S ribosomal protein L16 3-hydroxylase
MEPARTFSPELWSRFHEEHWGRSPAELRQPMPAPFATPAEVFRELQHACDLFRVGDRTIPLQLITGTETELTGVDLAEHLPQRGDAGIEAYAERVTRRLDGARFTLLLNSCQRHSPLLWRRTRQFLKPLLALIPAYATSPALFLGNYSQTPYGIHRDPSSLFLFVLHGRKRLRVWPGQAFLDAERAKPPRAYQSLRHLRPDVDEAAAQEEALVLEGGTGDVLFCPSTYWHIGESVEGLSLSVNAGLTPVLPGEEIWARLSAEVDRRMREHLEASPLLLTLHDLPEAAGTIPVSAKRAMEELAQASESATLRHALEVSWLNTVTAGGCQPPPPPLPWRRLEDEVVVCADPAFPIRWLPAPDRKIVLSAGGASFTLPANPRVLQLIERLNGGEATPVGRLIAEHAGDGTVDGVRYSASPEGLRTVLSRLYSFRALEEVRIPDREETLHP